MRRSHPFSSDPYLAVVGRDEPGNNPYQSRFPASRRTDNGKKFSLFHVQRDIVKGPDALYAIIQRVKYFADAFDR